MAQKYIICIAYFYNSSFRILLNIKNKILGAEPLPEGLFWLLLTGDIPTEAQVINYLKVVHKM